MRGVDEDKILRVLDANFNRAKEGLRVCEDVARFILDDKRLTQQYKKARHTLSQACPTTWKRRLIAMRDSHCDVGRAVTTTPELTRKTVKDVFLANSQRVKESVRVLEEFLKLLDAQHAVACKEIRYQVYILEQKVLGRIS